MTSVTPVNFECQFTQMGPGSKLVDTSPGGGQVTVGYEPPLQVGIQEDFYAPTHIHVTRCAYGSVGSAEVRTAISTQPFGDFMTKCRQSLVGVDLYVTADTSTLHRQGSVQKSKIFEGYVEQPAYRLGSDELSIPCRDRSSLLMETDVQARWFADQVIYEIVSELVSEAGFTTNLVSTAGAASLKVGTFLKNSRSTVAHKSSSWQFILRLADACGLVAFATPAGAFYFGPRVRTDLPLLSLAWGGQSLQGDLLGDPEVVHTTQRNGAFHVQVSSHDPESGTQTQHTVTYVNPQWTANGAQGGTTGQFLTNLTESQARDQFGQIQVYDYYAEGLTPRAAADKAMAHALDIQAHEIIVKCQVLGNASIEVGQAVQFINTGLPTLDKTTFFLAGVSHDLAIGQTGSTAAGFVTSLVAWQALPGGT